MQVLYVGHACLIVEVAGKRILMDPWMVGSVYCNAWWHVPPLAHSVEDLLPIDIIMISHVHEDHFHVPTLKLLPKSATVVIPYSFDPWMKQTIEKMGFARVIECEHALSLSLGPGLRVENFHFGRLDSAYWLEANGETLLNLNDCPLSVRWVQRFRRTHPSPDIALGIFSYSSPYPLCYDIPGVEHHAMMTENRQRYLRQFARTMAALQPRFSVPIATQYGFLGKDQWWMNSFLPTPGQALASLAEENPKVRGVVLNPGDRLSSREGFQPGGPPFDWGQRETLIPQLAQQRAQEIRKAFELEIQPPQGWFDQFSHYFDQILRRNPLLRRRIGTAVAFVPAPHQERWVVDCSRPSHWTSRQGNPSAAIEIHLPEALLYAAVEGQAHWENLYGSCRLQVRVPAELLDREWNFWRMLFNFRQGMLQDRLAFLSPRGIRVLYRRRREMGQILWKRLLGRSHREPDRDF